MPLRNVEHRIVKWVGTNTDIHEKVLAEQELRDAHRRKDEFLAMLAHELRNPLVPIGAGAEMLAMANSEDQRVREVSDMIRRQVKHVTGLINDLLEVFAGDARTRRARVAYRRYEAGAARFGRAIETFIRDASASLESASSCGSGMRQWRF